MTEDNASVIFEVSDKILEKEEQEAQLKMVLAPRGVKIQFIREFDPGSGRTLAACLTHASRTECFNGTLRSEDEVT